MTREPNPPAVVATSVVATSTSPPKETPVTPLALATPTALDPRAVHAALVRAQTTAHGLDPRRWISPRVGVAVAFTRDGRTVAHTTGRAAWWPTRLWTDGVEWTWATPSPTTGRTPSPYADPIEALTQWAEDRGDEVVSVSRYPEDIAAAQDLPAVDLSPCDPLLQAAGPWAMLDPLTIAKTAHDLAVAAAHEALAHPALPALLDRAADLRERVLSSDPVPVPAGAPDLRDELRTLDRAIASTPGESGHEAAAIAAALGSIYAAVGWLHREPGPVARGLACVVLATGAQA